MTKNSEIMPEPSQTDSDALDRARGEIYRQMAESILVAHDINPNSWAVREYERRITLFVGIYTILAIPRDSVGHTSIVLMAPFPDLGNLVVEKADFEDASLSRVRLSAEEWAVEAQELAEAHLRAVAYAARTVKDRTHRWNLHDPEVVREIDVLAETELPTPAYVEGNYTASSQILSNSLADDLNASSQFWKISAGRGNRDWPTFRDGSFIAIGWEEVAYIPALASDQGEFTVGLRKATGVSSAGATALWQFIHGMKVGDRVVSTARGDLYGVGTIVEDYESVDDDFPYRHRRKVVWTSADRVSLDHLSESTRSLLSRQATIIQLTSEQFAEIIGQNLGQASPVVVHPLEVIQRNVRAQGLTYTSQELATFYAALQTKGFVILSGISGTGKSKLAQAFVRCLPDHTELDLPGALAPTEHIARVVNKTAINSGLINLPSSEILRYPIPEPNAPTPVEVDFEGIYHTCTFTVWKSVESGTVYRLYFSGEIRRRIVSLPLGTLLFILPLLNDERTKIRGFSITTSIDEEIDLDRVPSVTIKNNLFLSVRPDWRDSRALLGYHNPLLGSYEWTDFLRFVLRAAENFRGPVEERIAWFVILDEMNLAHVEYYFADLLSVLESGRDGDGWTHEAIRIERPEPSEDQDDAEVPPATVHLPPNLYIAGTVNMDETTHAFSPKVLDRAFTIELSEVDFGNYPPEPVDADELIDDVERRALLNAFSRDGHFVGIDKAEVAAVVEEAPILRTWLQNLNRELTRSRMQFGYRVFDEISAFVGAYRTILPESTLEEAFDLAVLMKVLPKFSGSASRLERPLLALLAWCVDPMRLPQAEIRKLADAVDAKDWIDRDLSALGVMPFPITVDRVKKMLDMLAVDGFASYG